ncbi:MAG: hypothetical protein ACOX8R_07590 [Bacillota bacterium]|jgi:hypothetical protein
MAYKIHVVRNNNDIEFIVASCEEGFLSLHCIKDQKIHKDCQFAWIGSPIAHNEFQEYRNKYKKRKASDLTEVAFHEIVQGCSDKSVGGFHIIAGYDQSKKSLCYKECKTFHTSKYQYIQLGEKIHFFLNVRDGGFSFEQIPISLEDLILKIDQMDPLILYSRRLRMNKSDINNTQLFSLMLPMLILEKNNDEYIRL